MLVISKWKHKLFIFCYFSQLKTYICIFLKFHFMQIDPFLRMGPLMWECVCKVSHAQVDYYFFILIQVLCWHYDEKKTIVGWFFLPCPLYRNKYNKKVKTFFFFSITAHTGSRRAKADQCSVWDVWGTNMKSLSGSSWSMRQEKAQRLAWPSIRVRTVINRKWCYDQTMSKGTNKIHRGQPGSQMSECTPSTQSWRNLLKVDNYFKKTKQLRKLHIPHITGVFWGTSYPAGFVWNITPI